MERVDVAVVGAGLSGLIAARILAHAGRRVMVLEARDRVGGRIEATHIDGVPIDLGAQWVGAGHNRVTALVHEAGSSLYPTRRPGKNVMESAGRVHAYEGTVPRLSLLTLIDLQLGLWRTEAAVRAFPAREPWNDAAARALDAETTHTYSRRMVYTKQARQVFDATARTIAGAEPAEVSLFSFLYYLKQAGSFEALYETEGGAQQDRVTGGTARLPVFIANELGSAVRTGAPVRRIARAGEALVVEGAWGVLGADRVIVAVPPHLCTRIEFDPPVSAARERLHRAMRMGSTTKAIALYDRPFWRERGFSGEAVGTGDPLSVVFDASPATGGPYMLLGFLVGAAARRWGLRDATARKDAVLGTFARMFGDEARRPAHYIEKDWEADPWARGCPAATFTAGTAVEALPHLREPHGRVHWASTETAREWSGYMEGAVEAGERAAAEVLAG